MFWLGHLSRWAKGMDVYGWTPDSSGVPRSASAAAVTARLDAHHRAIGPWRRYCDIAKYQWRRDAEPGGRSSIRPHRLARGRTLVVYLFTVCVKGAAVLPTKFALPTYVTVTTCDPMLKAICNDAMPFTRVAVPSFFLPSENDT